jgi:membrane protein implicated in regulation of membrane protease activity
MIEYLAELSRKYIVTLVAMFLASGLMFIKVIDASHWVSVMVCAITSYMAANVAQRYVEKKNDTDDRTTPTN